LLSVVKAREQIIIFGPGETKKKFANFLASTKITQNIKLRLLKELIPAVKMVFTYLPNLNQ